MTISACVCDSQWTGHIDYSQQYHSPIEMRICINGKVETRAYFNVISKIFTVFYNLV